MLNKIIAVLLLVVSLSANADNSIHIIIPAGPGGQIDIMCRDLEKAITQQLNRHSYCDFKPGAGGYIGLQQVARTRTNEVLVSMIDSMSMAGMFVNFKDINIDDYHYIGMVGNTSIGLAMNNNHIVKLNDIRSIADNGIGGLTHYHTWELGKRNKTDIMSVPFKSRGEMYSSLLNQDVDAMWGTATSLQAYQQSGKVSIIAVVGPHRVTQLPNVPTFSELGYKNFGVQSSWIVFANATADQETLVQLQGVLSKPIFSDATGVVPDPANFSRSRELIQTDIQNQTKFVDYIKSLNNY
jgi:tripartite-type tricarboxylate transporter receptor subunit TctC